MASHWECPPAGYVKLNTDASCLGNPGKASYGGIFRNESGGWMKGFLGKLPGLYTPLEAEAWAICKGLNLVKQFGFKKVFVETDSVGAMQLFSFRHLNQNHSMKDVIEEGLEILRGHKCVIIHTRRDGNSCADKLAELGGRELGYDCRVIHKAAPEVVELLHKDRFGENGTRASQQHPFWNVPPQNIVCAPKKSPPIIYFPPVCVPLMRPIGFLHHQQGSRGYLQPPRMIILH